MAQEPYQLDHPSDPLITSVADNSKVIELSDNEPEIIRYLDEPWEWRTHNEIA